MFHLLQKVQKEVKLQFVRKRSDLLQFLWVLYSLDEFGELLKTHSSNAWLHGTFAKHFSKGWSLTFQTNMQVTSVTQGKFRLECWWERCFHLEPFKNTKSQNLLTKFSFVFWANFFWAYFYQILAFSGGGQKKSSLLTETKNLVKFFPTG